MGGFIPSFEFSLPWIFIRVALFAVLGSSILKIHGIKVGTFYTPDTTTYSHFNWSQPLYKIRNRIWKSSVKSDAVTNRQQHIHPSFYLAQESCFKINLKTTRRKMPLSFYVYFLGHIHGAFASCFLHIQMRAICHVSQKLMQPFMCVYCVITSLLAYHYI